MTILLGTEEKIKSEEHLVNQSANSGTGRLPIARSKNVDEASRLPSLRLKELATISAPESRMLMVTPFDQSNVKAIEKGIQSANLGLNPATQGKFIRIVLPELSAERRQEFVKICRKMAEDGRVALRNERRQALEGLKKVKADGGVSEDEVKTAEGEVQKLTDQYIAKLDQHLAHKEKEILTV
ncbi:MAG: ribosome recycling factor [Verrucomicrobiae bacterium]|nr:ribosome recycling factor [Verrucomicrobiae bacterium]